MKFTNNWFDRDVRESWERHLLPLAGTICTYAELGVCEGASFAWVVKNILAAASGTRIAWAVDPFIAPRRKMQTKYGEYRQQFLDNIKELQAEYGGIDFQWAEMSSVNFMRRDTIPDGALDLAYVDSDHYSRVCTAEMVLAWLKLKVGGIMIVDDLQRRFFHRRPQTGEAVIAFRIAYEGSYEVLFHNRQQIALMKTE